METPQPQSQADPELLRWLSTEISAWATYVNHKEIMAWVSTALFVTVCGALIASPALNETTHDQVAIGVGISAIALCDFVFVQLRKRWIGIACLNALRKQRLDELGQQAPTAPPTDTVRPSLQNCLRENPSLRFFPPSVTDNYATTCRPRFNGSRMAGMVAAFGLIVGVGGGTAWVLIETRSPREQDRRFSEITKALTTIENTATAHSADHESLRRAIGGLAARINER